MTVSAYVLAGIRLGAQFVSVVVSTAAFAAFAREGSLANTGLFAAQLAVVLIGGQAADLGSQIIGVRDARAPTGLLVGRTVWAVLVVAVSAPVSTALGVVDVAGAFVVGAAVLATSLVGSLWIRLVERQRLRQAFLLEPALRIAGNVALILTLLSGSATPSTALAITYAPTILAALLGLREVAFEAPRVHRHALADVARKTWRYGVVTALSVVHFRADTILANAILGGGAAAIYSVGYRPFELALGVAQLIALPIYVVAQRQSGGDRQKSANTLVFVASGLFAAIAVAITAPWWSALVGGSAEYGESAEITRLLAISLPAAYATSIAGYVAVSRRRESLLLRVVFLCVLLNIAGITALAPAGGIVVVACVTAFTEFVAALLLLTGLGMSRDAIAVAGAVASIAPYAMTGLSWTIAAAAILLAVLARRILDRAEAVSYA